MWNPFKRLFYRSNSRAVRKDTQFIIKLLRKMAIDFSKLEEEVSENTSVIASAVTVMASLSQQIKDAAADPVKLKQITDNLDRNSKQLAEAIAASTVAEGDDETEPGEDEPGTGNEGGGNTEEDDENAGRP